MSPWAGLQLVRPLGGGQRSEVWLGDPGPGNIRLGDDGRIGLLDHPNSPT